MATALVATPAALPAYEIGSGQGADVPERDAEQAVLTAGNVAADGSADGFFGRVPLEVERLLRGGAVAGHRHHVGEAHGMVPGVVEAADVGVGEVLDDRERRRAR